MPLVRFNVNVMGYDEGDVVDLPQDWADRLSEHTSKVLKKDAPDPEDVKDADDLPDAVEADPAVEPKKNSRRSD